VLVAADNGRFQHPKPPLREGSAPKPFTWDNDVTICEGSVQGGISLASDASGNLYAARCSTDALTRIIIYKSADAGKSWSYFTERSFLAGGSPQPVLLTGSTGNKLYLFYLNSSQDGDIWMYSVAQDGAGESYEVKVDSDTITYFSACVDYENGNHLMVAYQKEEMGDPTPDLYTITSADYGETWGNEAEVTWFGIHPDIAYGRNGYVYLVWVYPEDEGYEILFIRSTDYCSPGSWVDVAGLTDDLYFNDYPKVAALHTLPDSTPYVWVAYNSENPAGTDIDLAYAYSYNGGKVWSTNHSLDSSWAYHEMACDLWTKESPDYHYVHVCYFTGRYVLPFPRGAIYYGHASDTNPTNWGFLFGISNHWPTQSEDGRKVCQGNYAPGSGFMGAAIVYAGKDPDHYSGDNFRNLWFDNSAWPVDVEEEMTEEEVPLGFSLSTNYPNPFNPETRIGYLIPKTSHVRLEIFNLLGQRIRTLVDEYQAFGERSVTWDGRDDQCESVASGVYFYRLQTEDFVETKKMVVIR
jgi:hypothetical protein